MTTTEALCTPSEQSPARRRARVAKLMRFAFIGAGSTALYLMLYAAFAMALHPQPANALALLVSAVANTAANRRFTYGVQGRADVAVHHAAGLAVFAVGLAFTSGALALLHLFTQPDRLTEMAALVAANLIVTALRFLALDRIFARATPGTASTTHDCLVDEDLR